MAAHTEWADANPELIKKLYATYQQAADWLQKNPDAAAPLMFPKRGPDDQKQIAALIRVRGQYERGERHEKTLEFRRLEFLGWLVDHHWLSDGVGEA